jgi:serine/threonine protein kinase
MGTWLYADPLNKPIQPLDFTKGIPDSTPIAASSSSPPPSKKRGTWLAGLDFGITHSGSTSKGVSNKMKLTPEQVSGATQNFSHLNKIGEGIRSTVYRGVTIPSNTSVAVKKFKGFVHEIAEKDLGDGFEILDQIRHWSLVKVLGYCCSRGVITLVSEYMPNGTLTNLMYPKQDTEVVTEFNWTRRFNAAIDVAEGLKYLHDECFTSTIHGSLRPSNILFNTFMEARVADFGVAKLLTGYLHAAGYDNSYQAPGKTFYIPPVMLTL